LSQVTVGQLLSLTSGIEVGENGKVPSYAAAARDGKAKHDPGAVFEYGPVPFQVFGELMRRKLKGEHEIAYAYLDERVLKPIGVHVTYWRTDDDDQRFVPSGAFLTAREWVKFGEFLRRGGRVDGEQVVAAELLQKLTGGTKANPGYGMSFWRLGAVASGDGPGTALAAKLKGGYMAAGAGKQRLFVLPAVEMVVVRQGETLGRGFDNTKFLGQLLSSEPQ
jgi:CubicO group peptidase (beta-lactamase class C family)